MAALGRRDGGLEASRAAPGHHHLLGPPRLGWPWLGFPPGLWVLDAAEPAVEPHAAHALLVAGEAGANVEGVAGARLRREVGVGDLASDHTDEVTVALAQGAVGLQGVLESSDSHDG